jgi:hypothetical protein
MTMAYEEGDTELFFQLMDVAAEGRLRNVQPLGCLGDAQGLSYGDERFDSSEIHGARIVYQIGIPGQRKMYWTARAAVRQRIARTDPFQREPRIDSPASLS